MPVVRNNLRRFLAILVATIAPMAGGTAQTWQAINLQPPGVTTYSLLNATSGTQQAGAAGEHAFIWGITAESGVDLNPAGATSSSIAATTGTLQAGSVKFGADSQPHAALWRGTAASFVDLNPTGASLSVATCVSGDRIGGYAVIGGIFYAGYWTGTADSFVVVSQRNGNGDSGSTTPYILAITPTMEAGYVFYFGSVQGSYYRGTLWNDSPKSSLLLSSNAAIYAATDTQQAGAAYQHSDGMNPHAAVWSGSSDSFTDLQPVGAIESTLFATDGMEQAGEVRTASGYNHAGFWTGTAASFVDLHAFLPGNYMSSTAKGIFRMESKIFVAGAAGINATLWIFDPTATPTPLPTATPTPAPKPTPAPHAPASPVISHKIALKDSGKIIAIKGRFANPNSAIEYRANRKGPYIHPAQRGRLPNWMILVKLIPGKNVVQIRAIDKTTGQTSRPKIFVFNNDR